MPRTYKQKMYADIDKMLDKYPRAKVSDVIWVLEAAAETLWRALPLPKHGCKVVERTKRYRIV